MIALRLAGTASPVIPELRKFFVEILDGSFFLLQQIGDEGLFSIIEGLFFGEELFNSIVSAIVGHGDIYFK